MAGESVGLVVILAVAFLPSLIYMALIRNIERFHRNPWSRMYFAFGWGAIAAILIAVWLENWLPDRLADFRPARVSDDLFLAVVIAPLAEEFAKVIGVVPLVLAKGAEEEDGLIYGAAAGLGFAATENLLYEVSALSVDFWAWVVVAVLRTLTSTLLHASATAMSGWGVAKLKRHGGAVGVVSFAGLYLVAVLMHGLFNLIASIGDIYEGEVGAILLSLLLVFVFAISIFRSMWRRIRRIDRASWYRRPV